MLPPETMQAIVPWPALPVRAAATETALAPSAMMRFAAGEPREVSYTPSFVDGCGSKGLLNEMWPLAKELINDSMVMSLDQIADAIRTLAERNCSATRSG